MRNYKTLKLQVEKVLQKYIKARNSWKPYSRDTNYEVDKSGKVRSIERVLPFGKTTRKYPAKMLTPTADSKGYKRVSVTNGKKVTVHRLVAETFIPNPKKLPQVNHIDSNPRNNDVSNLEWTDHTGNMLHYMKTNRFAKTCPRGERNGKSKLTTKQVKEIRKNGKTTTYTKLAKKYKVSYVSIRSIILGLGWKHIK